MGFALRGVTGSYDRISVSLTLAALGIVLVQHGTTKSPRIREVANIDDSHRQSP